ncbi:MAG: helix-turn-helix transcriptional regulator [Ruminococcaceae bacterium]|nr:helix-turn-helix transcriptional regulator [Oscillospiraceae bacterium]
MKVTLSERIKQLRTLHGMNQVDFAARIGVTKQCVSNWENDNVLPSIEMLVKLADFFRVSTDYLLGRENTRTLNVGNLTEEQCAHLRLLIQDLEKTNPTVIVYSKDRGPQDRS